MNVLRSNRVFIIVQSRTRLQRCLLCTDRGSGADKEKRLGDNTNFNKMTETKNPPSNLGSLSATEKERLLKDLSSDTEKVDLKSVEKAFREQRDFGKYQTENKFFIYPRILLDVSVPGDRDGYMSPTQKNSIPESGYMSPGSGTLFFWVGDM